MTLRLRRYPKQDFSHLPDTSRIWLEQEFGVTRRGKEILCSDDDEVVPKRPTEDPDDGKFPCLITH